MTTESDRELLELAAKAAGLPMGYADGQYFYCEHGPFGPGMYGKQRGAPLYWNPLTDDGDALRLAVKLNIEIIPGMAHWGPVTYTNYPNKMGLNGPSETHGADAMAATRRAIVRALKAGKKFLWSGRAPRDTGRFCSAICFAIDEAERSGKATEEQGMLAKAVIMDRLKGYGTLYSWLEGRGIPEYDLTSLNVQTHRHQWVDRLIAEFSTA